MNLESLRGAPILAMSSIGNPHSFERSLEQLGARLLHRLRFPDHHPYSQEEFSAAVKLAHESGARYVVTTEKDEVRLPLLKYQEIPVASLVIELKIMSGEKQLWELIERGA
jgi:tetraacyldisaccharide 4'-kinase